MSSFCAAPRQGHMDRVKRIYGYLSKMRHAVIQFHTDEPDFSAYPKQKYDWTRIYGDVKEVVPENAPEPLGPWVTLTHYVDANLFHDMVTSHSVTGILTLSIRHH